MRLHDPLIHDTLTRHKVVLPLSEGNPFRMYACGVTVYDKCHVGHARSLFLFDRFVAFLRHCYGADRVRFVRNITDIDDKIIQRAQELRRPWESLVEECIAAYEQDLDRLKIRRADVEPRATENIPDMIEDIRVMIEKGFAYESGGDVYFSVRAYPAYGRLSRQSLDEMREGVRIETGVNKKDPLDFAVWKASKPNEPSWPSPWGPGRPGWHIECSTMSRKFLQTDTLDLHAGGRDLIFPHHENEIAQAEAVTERPFCRAWMHHGLLTINGHKMSKSLGNFLTIEEVVQRHGVAPLKMFFLSAHYAKPIDFSEQEITEAKKAAQRIQGACAALGEASETAVTASGMDPLEDRRRAFYDALRDDFNTPKALAVVFEAVSAVHREWVKDPQGRAAAASFFKRALDILGLSDLWVKPEESLPDEIRLLLEQRQRARAQKNYALADEIRRRIHEMGFDVQDTKDGFICRRR